MCLSQSGKKLNRAEWPANSSGHIRITIITGFKADIAAKLTAACAKGLPYHTGVGTANMGTITACFNSYFSQGFWYSRDITSSVDHICDLGTIKGIGHFFCAAPADVQSAIGNGNTGLHIQQSGHTA